MEIYIGETVLWKYVLCCLNNTTKQALNMHAYGFF